MLSFKWYWYSKAVILVQEPVDSSQVARTVRGVRGGLASNLQPRAFRTHSTVRTELPTDDLAAEFTV